MNRNVSPTLVYAAALVLAACSLLYELLIAQTLAMLAANTVVWYSVTIGIYLAAMGLGALLHDRNATDNLWTRLFRIELLLSVVGMVAVPILHFSHTFSLLLDSKDFMFVSDVVFFGSAFLLIAVIGVLTGFELPLLVDLGNEAANETSVTNRVLASDYIGSMLGGIAFPLVLMPNLSLIVIGLLTAGVNLIVAFIALCWMLPKSQRSVLRLAANGLLATVILLGLFFAQPIERYFVKNYYFYFDYFDYFDNEDRLFLSLEKVTNIFRERSPYQRIDIVYDEVGYRTDILINSYSSKFIENPVQPRNYTLFLNGDFQLASNYEEYYHEFFAHVPIITNGAAPRRVLVMGGGDGLLIRELIKYPDIESIIHVDLDHKFVELAKTHPVLLAMNEGAFADPRVRSYFDDAYRYIRNSTDSFDAIFLDFPDIKDYNLSKLYSREFYHFVRQRLAPGGFIALDTPDKLVKSSITREIYSSTIKTAGFKYVRPYNSTIEDFNPQAMEILLREGYGEKAARRLLVGHALSRRSTFIIARDNLPESEKLLYLDPRVKLHVLTEDRLLLTLQNRFPPLKAPDPRKVNSIFRPTLPEGEDVWKIRKAW